MSYQRQEELAEIAALIQLEPYSKMLEWSLIHKFGLSVTSPKTLIFNNWVGSWFFLSLVTHGIQINLHLTGNPVDTRRKFNVHKAFRRRPRRLLNVLCMFNLRPVFTGSLGQFSNSVSFPDFEKLAEMFKDSEYESQIGDWNEIYFICRTNSISDNKILVW